MKLRSVGALLVVCGGLCYGADSYQLNFDAVPVAEVAGVLESLAGVPVQVAPGIAATLIHCVHPGNLSREAALTVLNRSLRLHSIACVADDTSMLLVDASEVGKAEEILSSSALGEVLPWSEVYALRHCSPADAFLVVQGAVAPALPLAPVASPVGAPGAAVASPAGLRVGSDETQGVLTVSGPGVTAVVYTAGSVVLFTGQRDAVERVRGLLASVDRPVAQVAVELVIAEVVLVDGWESGVDWTAAIAAGRQVAGSAVLAGATPLGQAGAVLRLSSEVDGWEAVIKAMDSSGRFKVHHRPMVTTANHVPAMISVGEQVPIPGESLSESQRGNGQNASVATTLRYVPVQLRITVTPHVEASGVVRLEVDQVNESLGAVTNIGGNDVPRIQSQSLNSILTVRSGGCVVVGGIRSDGYGASGAGLPFLSRIPVVRFLVGTQSRKRERRELVILARPVILPGTDTLDVEKPRGPARPAATKVLDITDRFR